MKIKLKEASHLKAFDWKQFLSLKIIIGLLHFEANLALIYRFPPKLSFIIRTTCLHGNLLEIYQLVN